MIRAEVSVDATADAAAVGEAVIALVKVVVCKHREVLSIDASAALETLARDAATRLCGTDVRIVGLSVESKHAMEFPLRCVVRIGGRSSDNSAPSNAPPGDFAPAVARVRSTLTVAVVPAVAKSIGARLDTDLAYAGVFEDLLYSGRPNDLDL